MLAFSVLIPKVVEQRKVRLSRPSRFGNLEAKRTNRSCASSARDKNEAHGRLIWWSIPPSPDPEHDQVKSSQVKSSHGSSLVELQGELNF
ncbi:hypothetical protein DTO063F5_1502 [Paecilomyces variotii]|nr:hypothetical protein DTO063F5_1502 [Paecilomyces variotii]